MPSFSVTDPNMNWDQFTSGSVCTALTGGHTANLVIRFQNQRQEKVYVKFLESGQGVRSQFASEVIQVAGLRTYNSRVVMSSSPEGQKITDRVRKVVLSSESPDMVAFINEQYGRPEILIMSDLKENRANIGTYAAIAENNLSAFMTKPDFIKGIGRMIAADAILGNYDRISYVDSYFNDETGGNEDSKGSWAIYFRGTKFHPDNFLVDPESGEIIPLDNDTVLFDIQDSAKSATPQLWLDKLIHGGNIRDKESFVVELIPSLDKILSPDFSEIAVRRIFKGKKLSQIEAAARDGIDVDAFYKAVARAIQDGVRDIIANLKRRNGSISGEGLNKHLKAMQQRQMAAIEQGEAGQYAADGLNYDAFKLKMRYAMLVTDPNNPASSVNAEQDTEYYMKYRVWKSNLLLSLSEVSFDPQLPTPLPSLPHDMGMFRKFVRNIASPAARVLGFRKEVFEFHELKAQIRQSQMELSDLRQAIQKIALSTSHDPSKKKVYAEAVTDLTIKNIYYNVGLIEQFFALEREIPFHIRWTPLYINAIKKHIIPKVPQVGYVVSLYERYCSELTQKYNSLGVADNINKASKKLVKRYDELNKRIKAFGKVHHLMPVHSGS